MPFQGKRKRYSKDTKCMFFPDVKAGVRIVGRGPSITDSSATKSWESCGDSFLDTPVIKNLSSSGNKWRAVRRLAQSPAQVQCSGLRFDEDPVHIAWSSSESELSDSEPQGQQPPPTPPSNIVAQVHRGPRRPGTPIQSYSLAQRMLSTETDELPTIDTDSDVDVDEAEDDQGKKEDGVGEISDCESEPCAREPKESSPKPTTVTDTDISDYLSDGEGESHDTLSQNRLEAGVVAECPLHTGAGEGEGSRRSVSDWVRSAQAALQTPQKQTDRNSKTPEDSSKKKRTFQSGGMAERLNRLQCRQRSAISFWRHQSISHTTTTATVDKPGVLVLEVLSVQEESCMQLALCEQHHPHATGHHRPPSNTTTTMTRPEQHNPSATDHTPLLSTTNRARVLVLFSKETTAQLMPAPRDLIHIYPPWQSLMIEGQHNSIILNTHFSQKVYSDTKQTSMSLPRALVPVERCSPYSLTRSFGQLEINKTSPEGDGTVKQSLCSQGGPGAASSGGCHSLLEAIEGLGQAGSVGQDVEVVVQRVYCTPIRERSTGTSLKSRAPGRPPRVPTPLQKGKSRLCALVQDGYGMFSMVQLHPLPSEDPLHLYTRKWEGRTCVLRAIKVVQRVTRERWTRLFSLIDSLWPPVMPFKVLGENQSCQGDSIHKGPAPSFCYLLSCQEGSVEPVEGQPLSSLYLPPTEQTLRDILQCDLNSHRCSFAATVIYKRTQSQSSDRSPGEVWLVVTDPSLQEEQQSGGTPCRRTLAVCVTTSCVLTSSVAKAITTPSACRLSFRDAVREHGGILCVEQSVVLLLPLVSVCCPHTESTLGPGSLSLSQAKSLPQPLPQAQPHVLPQALPQPVTLDPLGPETPPNSLCTFSGVIVGVDEDTAYSWPVCSLCGSDLLEMTPQKPQAFLCVACDSLVDQPTMNMQLEVFMNCSTLRDFTVKVKLQQSTIMSVLNCAASGHEFPGYEVENVLGKEVGPLSAYVRVVTRKPAPSIGLEEICL
ncbi:DNA repair-scaffolding protein-like [Salvelinus alpinus]|uniref:DNA repair-scaffolding protein-like n=1 Tax=Salvelinus alpinus TaxID=8036 RepID=UPI0039FD1AE0